MFSKGLSAVFVEKGDFPRKKYTLYCICQKLFVTLRGFSSGKQDASAFIYDRQRPLNS